jgi:hypothetical protein
MGAVEIAGRARKRCIEIIDARAKRDWTSVSLKPGLTYPQFPSPSDAPESLRSALRRDVEEILAGKWRAFGSIPMRVTDPPEWDKDYLAGVDLPTDQSAFALNHRELADGADIKMIWELSRWHSLTRLALAAYVLEDARAGWKCVHWLEHWAQHNPAYRGWNWTSALESGMRLIQFTWIEALLRPLAARGEGEAELEQLRYEILPAHVWFTWRHKSFGSSANNHLLGELAGLMVAAVRWPELMAWGASLDELQSMWEREVLGQFAEDGGNREQALNYHLFSFELCWHTRSALRAAGRSISSGVEERLALAVEFFKNVEAPVEHWPYGDSDDGFVLPIAANTQQTTREWFEWAQGYAGTLDWFIDEAPKSTGKFENFPDGWRVFGQSGMAVNRTGKWFLRWDGSPLGYLNTAAHGHLDALHLSVWLGDTALIIDPGTGAYYGGVPLRNWLASRAAHNGPAAPGGELLRAGTFLWAEHHAVPRIIGGKAGGVAMELPLPSGAIRRGIYRLEAGDGWRIEDQWIDSATPPEFTVLWQFAPETICREIERRRFAIARQGQAMEIRVGDDWETVDLMAVRPTKGSGLVGTVSPHFRQTVWAPCLRLVARPQGKGSCVFQTVFLASHH